MVLYQNKSKKENFFKEIFFFIQISLLKAIFPFLTIFIYFCYIQVKGDFMQELQEIDDINIVEKIYNIRGV